MALIDLIYSEENLKRIDKEKVKFLVYNGGLRDIVEKILRADIKSEQARNEICSRIVPINYYKKIIRKLARVYLEAPQREPLDKNPNDVEMLSIYQDSMSTNQKMKQLNRFFKSTGHSVIEPYVDFMGRPKQRSLPSHTYTVIGEDPIEPERMTKFVKHINMSGPRESHRHAVYTDQEFFVIDGMGNIMAEEMALIQNEDGVNPFGKIPAIFCAEQDDNRLIPMSDDDILYTQFIISISLAELTYAQKYQAFSVLAFIGVDESKFEMNPSSALFLPADARIDIIKPEMDTQDTLLMISEFIKGILTTNDLSVNDISVGTNARNAESGIAKIIDQAEPRFNVQDQEEFFRKCESEYWELIAHHMHPVWRDSGLINSDFFGAFSDDFELKISFAEPPQIIPDREKIENQIMLIQNGLTTRRKAINTLNPELDSEEVDDFMAEIEKEKVEAVEFFQSNMNNSEDEDGEEPQA